MRALSTPTMQWGDPALDPGENVVSIAAAMILSDSFAPYSCRVRKTPDLHFEVTGKLPQGCVVDLTQTPNVCFFEHRPATGGRSATDDDQTARVRTRRSQTVGENRT
jgi:hypothetical protein